VTIQKYPGKDSSKMVFVLSHDLARRNAVAAVANAPAGYKVTVSEPSKTRDQEEKYHAAIGEIARANPEYMGMRLDAEDWKRLLVDMYVKYRRELGKPLRQDGRIVPALDRQGFVQLGVQTRRFLKEEASGFIEFLDFYAATLEAA